MPSVVEIGLIRSKDPPCAGRCVGPALESEDHHRFDAEVFGVGGDTASLPVLVLPLAGPDGVLVVIMIKFVFVQRRSGTGWSQIP